MRHGIGSHGQAAAIVLFGASPNSCPKRGATFAARSPVVVMEQVDSSLADLPHPGRPTNLFAGFLRLVRQRGMRIGIEPQVKQGGPLSEFVTPLSMEADSRLSRLRLALRPRLRLLLLPSLRGPGGSQGRYRAPQRRLRACRFADIPTPLPIQNTFKEAFVMFSSHFFSASLALDACATTSALARQRFCITSATGIALVPATPEPQTIITGSALASQPLAVNRPLPWRSA
jgi:hypothetical protein